MVIFFVGFFLLSILILLYMFKEAFTDRVKEQELDFPSLPPEFSGFSIFFISDIHRRKLNNRIMDRIKGKVDIVVIGGDLTEKGVPIERIKCNLKKLTSVAPVYFIWGNNDYEVNGSMLTELLEEYGVVELKNKVAELKRGTAKLALIGLDDLTENRPPLSNLLEEIENDTFRILLCHNPSIEKQIKVEHHISLLLSGHTHGGQIRLFGFGPYQLGGVHHHQGTTVLVSNGYGTTALPLRLGAKAETHIIKLTTS